MESKETASRIRTKMDAAAGQRCAPFCFSVTCFAVHSHALFDNIFLVFYGCFNVCFWSPFMFCFGEGRRIHKMCAVREKQHIFGVTSVAHILKHTVDDRPMICLPDRACPRKPRFSFHVFLFLLWVAVSTYA